MKIHKKFVYTCLLFVFTQTRIAYPDIIHDYDAILAQKPNCYDISIIYKLRTIREKEKMAADRSSGLMRMDLNLLTNGQSTGNRMDDLQRRIDENDKYFDILINDEIELLYLAENRKCIPSEIARQRREDISK